MRSAAGIILDSLMFKIEAAIAMHKMIQSLQGSLKPMVVRVSGLIGLMLVAAAFLGSLQDSLAAGG